MEDLHRIDLCIRSFFANRSRYRSSMTEPVDEICFLTPIRKDRHAARNSIHMRMPSMDSAVDYRNA